MQYDFLALCQLFATANVIVLGLLCLVALAVKIVRFGVWQGAAEVEFVTPVTPGGSVKFLPAV